MRAARKRVRDERLQSEAAVPVADTEGQKPKELRKFILSRWRTAGFRFTAKDVGTLCHFATSSQGQGIEDLAQDPRLKGDNHNRNMSKTLGLDNLESCGFVATIELPLYDKNTNSRTDSKIWIRYPHEVFNDLFEKSPESFDMAKQDFHEIGVPSFTDHPLTREYGIEEVKPSAYYTDKVKLNRHDTFYRGSINISWMRARETCWAVQSSFMCRCGCNGHCTTNKVQYEINWSFNVLQDKIWPTRWRQRSFTPGTDDLRIIRSGKPMHVRAALTEYRGDWPERADKAGLKNHSGRQACMCCTCGKEQLHASYHLCSMAGLPWDLMTHERYLDLVTSSLIRVNLESLEDRNELVSALEFRASYPWGRYVSNAAHVGRHGLRTGYTLQVGGSIEDVHQLDELQVPSHVFFMLPHVDSQLTHVSIMWPIPGVHDLGVKGFTIERIVDCTLHTIDLGPLQKWEAKSLYEILDQDALQTNARRISDRRNLGVLALRPMIKDHYKALREANPLRSISRIKRFTVGILGPASNPSLSANGGESRDLLELILELLRRFAGVLGDKGMLLQRAGESLVRLYTLTRESPRVLPVATQDALFSCVVEHNILAKAAGILLIPKHHSLIHMVFSARMHGNPAKYSTFEDESANGSVALVAFRSHPSTFSETIFKRLLQDGP